MAGITILPREVSSGERIGESFGQGLQTGLAGLLNDMAQNRALQMQAQQIGHGLRALLPDLSQEQALAAGYVPESILSQFVKQKLQEPQQQAYASALQALLGGTQSSAVPGERQNAIPSQSLLAQAPVEQSIFPSSTEIQPEKTVTAPVIPKGLTAQQATQLAKIGLEQRKAIKHQEYQDKRIELEQKKLAAKAKTEQTKEQRIEQHHIDKETAPIYDEINKEYKGALENDKRLNRMEELVNKGNLGIPFVNSGIKALANGIFGAGIDLTSLMTADAQEFDKLSTQFASAAKDVFPGRVTNADLNIYMRQIPNLSQSAAGIKRIISSMRFANEASKLRKNAMDEVIIANNGLRPRNMDSLIENKIGTQLDELAKAFLNAPRISDRFLGGITRY